MAIQLRDVMRVMAAHDGGRVRGLSAFRASGLDLDGWTPAHRRAWVDAMVACEDWLEGVAGKGAALARSRVRSVRRELEVAVWG